MKLLSSVQLVGSIMSEKAQTFSGSDLRPTLEAMCPMKLISGFLSSSFSRLSLMPTSTHLWRKSRSFLSWVSSSVPCMMISSVMHITPSSPSRDSFMRHWNISPDTFKPKGSLVQWYRPKQDCEPPAILSVWAPQRWDGPQSAGAWLVDADGRLIFLPTLVIKKSIGILNQHTFLWNKLLWA